MTKDASQEVLKNLKAGGNISIGDVHVGHQYQSNGPREITVSDVGGTPPNFDRYWVDRTSYQLLLTDRISAFPVTEIVAIGGFGKSSLAAWGYANLRGGFQKRLWVSFGQPKTFDRVARWILQEVGFPNKDPEVKNDGLLRELIYRLNEPNTPVKTLVVLDQLETIVEADDRQWFERFLMQWAENGQESRVLVTTRSPFLSQEPIALGGLNQAEGATFLGREGLTGDRFSQLIDLTKGHPLLLKLAASWTKETYKSQVDDRAIDFFTKLFSNYKGDPTAGVEAIFGVIFGALPPALQTLLCGLSVYRLPIDIAMAQAMQPHIKVLQEETLKNFNINLQNTFLEATKTALQSLCDWGLLLSQDDRFILHPLVAGLVRSRVTEDVRRDGHERAIGYFRVNFRENRIDGNLESCRAELEVFHHTCEIRDYEEAFLTYCEISEFLRDWNFSQEHIKLLELLIEQWGRQEDNLDKIGSCLGNLSYPYQNLGNYQKAIDYSFQCLEVMHSINNQYGISVVLTHLGSVHSFIGDHQKEIEFHSQSLDIDRAIGNRNGEGGSLCNIGIAYASLGKYEQAIDFFQQALPIQREVGNREFEANSLNGIGNAYKSLGNYQKAIDFHIQSLEVNKSINNKSGIASSLGNLGL